METIIKNVEEVVASQAKNFQNDEKMRELENANEMFKDLIKRGLAKKRGYNLQSINSPAFNTNL